MGQDLHLANLLRILSRVFFFFFLNGLASLSWFAGLNYEAVNIQHIKLSSLFVLAVISSVMMAGTD